MMHHVKDFLNALSVDEKKRIEENIVQLVNTAGEKLLLEAKQYREALNQSKPTTGAAERVVQALDDLKDTNTAFRTAHFLIGRRLP